MVTVLELCFCLWTVGTALELGLCLWTAGTVLELSLCLWTVGTALETSQRAFQILLLVQGRAGAR